MNTRITMKRIMKDMKEAELKNGYICSWDEANVYKARL